MGLPPGPSRTPLRNVWDWIRRPLRTLDDHAARFGKRFTLRWTGGRTLVISGEREDAKKVFSGPPDLYLSGKGNERFRAFLGEHSIIALDGPEHQRHRRLMIPPFRGERMRAYAGLISELTRESLARWPRGAPFPVLDRVYEITLRVIFQAIFGVRDPALTERLVALHSRCSGRAPTFLAFVPALQIDLGPLSPWGRFRRARAELDAILLGEIARARAEAGTGREDILAKLIEESAKDAQPLSDAEMRDALLTLLSAGHETTTSGLAWAFRFILGNEEVRQRALKEIRTVVPSGEVEAAHVKELEYLGGCIEESLRLVPPIPLVHRALAAPVQLGEHELPAGVVLAPSPYLIQHDPTVFDRPDEFRPERFIGRRPGAHEHFPFGGGARTCIGLPFALLEMKVILATVLARADLALACSTEIRPKRKGIIVIPADGTPIIARPKV
jgi:cytochrome P450